MKQRGLMKKLSAVLLATAMTVSAFPQLSTPVFAADTANELPTTAQFATVEQLKSFNTDDTNDGTENRAKVYFGNNNQQWWIAGSQDTEENTKKTITLFAASPLATKVQFDSSRDERDYNGQTVYANHYGASLVRNTLQTMTDKDNHTYFSKSEQELMNVTTVYTNDEKHQDKFGGADQGYTDLAKESVYSTKDKLYLPYGEYFNKEYITVGENSVPDNISTVSDLNNGLRVDTYYWGIDYKDYYFWLRSAFYNNRSQGLLACPGIIGMSFPFVDALYALVPAFELNLSDVYFASAAEAASSDGPLSVKRVNHKDVEGAFTLRYKTDNLGSALVSYDKSKVTLTNIPTNKDVYLVVQDQSGARAKQITTETEVSASNMKFDSFANCKVWLETTDTTDRITYATLATEEQRVAVNVTAGDGLSITSNNGAQEVAPNTAITDITVEVADGYYLPDDYISNLQSQLNGLSVSKTDKGFTISGTPTSDVGITLPAATVSPKSDTPVVELKTTSTSITATLTNYKDDFGDIEYKWNDGNWEKDKNTLSDLDPETTYKLAVRFTGKGIYQPSDEYSVEITTLKDGNTVIVVPIGLTTTYEKGLTLSDVDLSNTGWTWVDGNTALSAGTNSYPATFDTTALESTTDFSVVDGYDPATHKVTKNVEVKVNKADSQVTITTQSLDKAYDGKVVNNPKYKTSGAGEVSIKWQKNTGSVDTPKWEDLKSAPSSVGNYQVVVSLGENDNYNPASAALDFTISKADNTWAEELSITGWTYNETANVPTAKAKFGDVVFTYSREENGTYTNEVPKNAGTYYVKATVAGTENHTGLESVVSFEIAKAIPAYEKLTGLVLGQGQALSKIELPEQFKWVDETMTADELGTHTFKAVYTPEDTANYQTIEVEIEVEVVPTPVAVNHVPTISASDKTITVGDKFDSLKDVTANDKEDGDLTSKIKVISNTVDTKKAGTYEVTYQVTDSQGAAVTRTIKVTVKAAPVNPDQNKPINDKGSVETGDPTNVGLFTSLLMISALGIAVLAISKKKKALEHK